MTDLYRELTCFYRVGDDNFRVFGVLIVKVTIFTEFKVSFNVWSTLTLSGLVDFSV